MMVMVMMMVMMKMRRYDDGGNDDDGDGDDKGDGEEEQKNDNGDAIMAMIAGMMVQSFPLVLLVFLDLSLLSSLSTLGQAVLLMVGLAY